MRNMSETVKVKHSIGINAIAVLMTAIFISLKLAGCISWSWLAAFSPILVVVGLELAILLLLVIVVAGTAIFFNFLSR